MIKKKWLFIFTLFMLVFLVIPTVSAWTELDSYDMPTSGSGSQNIYSINPVDSSSGLVSNFTRYDWTGSGWISKGGASGSTVISLCSGLTRRGGATLTWNFPAAGSWQTGTVSLTNISVTGTDNQLGFFEADNACTGDYSAGDGNLAIEKRNLGGGAPSGLYHFHLGVGGHYDVYSGSAVPPTTNRTVVFTIKNLANQVIPNVYADLYAYDNSYHFTGTSNSSGMIQWDNCPVPDGNTTTNFGTAATGLYNAYQEAFTFDSSPLSKTVYLQPASPSGTYANLTYHVADTIGIPLENVLVYHTISSNYNIFDYTDTEGNVTFYDTPIVNNAFYYHIEKSGYYSLNGFLEYTGNPQYINVTMVRSSVSPTPTPTITQAPPEGYFTLSANPNSILLGATSTLVLDSTNSQFLIYPNALLIDYYENNGMGGFSSNSGYRLIGVYRWNVTNSDWDFRTNLTSAWSYSGNDPQVLEVTPTTGGTYTYRAIILNSQQISQGTAEAQLEVNSGGGTSGNLVMNIFATDATDGAHLQDYTLELSESITGTIHTYDVDYDLNVNLVRGFTYSLTGSKSGYDDRTIEFTVPVAEDCIKGDYCAIANIQLFRSGSHTAGNTTVTVHVADKETYYPMPNAKVTISGTGLSYAPQYTSVEGGAVSFELPQNTEYSVFANKDGYCGATTTKNTSTLDFQYVDMYLKYGNCAGNVTFTPTPTLTPTVTPTSMYGNLPNQSAAAVCGNLPVNATMVDTLRNSMACNGITDILGQNMAISLLIMLFGGIILGRIAKGIGVLAGVIAGAAVSMVMGFLPLFIIIIVIIMAGLVFAARIFWSSDK